MTALVWFRRTLRLDDHRALLAACATAPQVVPVFVLDPTLIARPDTGSRRFAFLVAALQELDTALRARGSYLIVRTGDPAEELVRLARETGATALFHSREYEPFGRQRDQRVHSLLSAAGIACTETPDLLLCEPEQIATQAGRPYTVFTPFFRNWQQQPTLAPQPAPEWIATPAGIAGVPLPVLGTVPLPGSETAAHARLAAFCQAGLATYAERRDGVAQDGTSQLSPYLRMGILSVRRVLAALRATSLDTERFLSQLAWREFYYHILWHFPHVAERAFQPTFESLAWENDERALAAWKAGETGYPIVDAALRQLAQTGWMHNRARMIVASFLTKDLLCDWRLGEAHFMQQLVDGDQACNNGGWQWAASTGTDPQPYFRIFNPVAQGEKFDPDGAYVHRWVPELKAIPTPWVHQPWKLSAAEQRALLKTYPARIVEHALQRDKALALYNMAVKGKPR